MGRKKKIISPGRPKDVKSIELAGCFGCEQKWDSNANFLAAAHHDATGHKTWCRIEMDITYGIDKAPEPTEPPPPGLVNPIRSPVAVTSVKVEPAKAAMVQVVKNILAEVAKESATENKEPKDSRKGQPWREPMSDADLDRLAPPLSPKPIEPEIPIETFLAAPSVQLGPPKSIDELIEERIAKSKNEEPVLAGPKFEL